MKETKNQALTEAYEKAIKKICSLEKELREIKAEMELEKQV